MQNWEIIKVNKCLSTNKLTKEKRLEGNLSDKTAILTDFQTQGRGQGENSWFSDVGKNLLVSLFRNTDLKVERHFMLTVITSLAIHETLKSVRIPNRIKWPNDIYVGDKKIAGVLIENTLMKDIIQDTIIGIGLNVNQVQFPANIPNPVSIAQVFEKEYDVDNIRDSLIENIDLLFQKEMNGEGEDLYNQYNSLLYRLQEWKMYEAEGKIFQGQIHGVMPDGRLIMETEEGVLKYFLFGGVRYKF